MAQRLFNPVDSNSMKSDKYVEHGTAISKLVPPAIRRFLTALAGEDAGDSGGNDK